MVKEQSGMLTNEEKKRAKSLGLNNILIEKARSILGEYWYGHIMPHQSSWRSTDEALQALGISQKQYQELRDELGLQY